MNRVASWFSSTPISKWTLLKTFPNTTTSLYYASSKQFLDAGIKNYTFNRPISQEHVTDLYNNLIGMNGAYVLFHNFIVSHCPEMDEENQWLLLDGQHRAAALVDLSDEAQENIICMILVITFPKTTQMERIQETFQKINYNRGTNKQEREIQQKKFEDFQGLTKLLVDWTKRLSVQGGRISCLTQQSAKPSKIRWKLSEPALREEIDRKDSPLANKTAEEIFKILQDENTRRQANAQEHINKHSNDDCRRDMFTRRFYIGYDFPNWLYPEQ